MFKFSMKWLKKYCINNIESDEILKILNLQGFEFQGEERLNDDLITTIEVKANRPDMLCHMGIAREINAYKNIKLPYVSVASGFNINNDKFNIKILNDNICKRFSIIKLENIDNSIETPEYIKSSLNSLGINTLNPVVDIINYVMLDLGQPMHCYDTEKLKNEEIIVKKSNENLKIETLNGDISEIQKDDILISNDKNPVCIAGIVGTNLASVTSKSKNILLEAGIFNEIDIRLTSRRLKISTPSSFRFERGIDSLNSFNILAYCAKMIIDICGGKIINEVFDYFPNKEKEVVINLSKEKVNLVLGTALNTNEIKGYLEKYGFLVKLLNDDNLNVTVPSHRILVKTEIELIGEIARIYGYENIKPVLPTIKSTYLKDKNWYKLEKIRSSLLSLGFSETINYSFVPSNLMEVLKINKDSFIFGDITLENPISSSYQLMRPTLCYSLINCLAYNYSIKNTDLSLFEINRTYFKNELNDTGFKELNTCGFIVSGIKNPKGWGQNNDIKYNYYDIISYLNTLMNFLGQDFELENSEYEFCKKGTSYNIIANGEKIGFIAEINKNSFNFIKNLKLVRDNIYYCEFHTDKLILKDKKLNFESKYPPIKRLYNFIHKKSVLSKDIINVIKSTSNIIIKIEVKDVYVDKNMQSDSHSVLYEVNYCSEKETLTLNQVETIENKFINLLKEKFNATLKQ